MKTLQDWLLHLETAHSGDLIDMGLKRTNEVKKRMKLEPQCPVVVVAGTNGKGSVCAYLTQIYKQAGFKVTTRSEERRVGKECRSRWSPYH